MKLSETSINEIKDILEESKVEFLPNKNDAHFDTVKFFQDFEDAINFNLFKLVDNNEQIYGFISNLPYKDHSAVIGPMYIRPEHRGQKLGYKLLELFIEWAHKNSFNSIITRTWGNNKASRYLFEEFGFVLIREKMDDRNDGDSTVTYSKKLD